uniref:RNA helicase n=1 Tax=Rhabditophanes sp. KR3021 TaxID=114890 RepID=A0AC35TPW0_9BILA
MSLNVSVRKPLKKRGRKDYVPEIRGADQTIELRRKTHARDVAFDEREELKNIIVSGELTNFQVHSLKQDTFSSLNVHPVLMNHLKGSNKEKLTTIQSFVCPAIMQGSFDVVISAPTGYGKTFAYLIPLMDYVLKRREAEGGFPQGRRPLAMIFTVTRDLAKQVFEDFCAFGEGSQIKGVLCYGEIRKESIAREIREGCDFIIGCCGKISDLVENQLVDLRDVNHLVLDEADKFSEVENFEPMKKLLMQGEVEYDSNKVKVILVSATIPDSSYEVISNIFLSRDNVYYNFSKSVNPNAVIKKFVFCHKHAKIDWLIATIRHLHKQDPKGKMLVFCESRNVMEVVALRMLFAGIKTISLSGNRSQEMRDEAIKRINQEDGIVLISTDVAERGVDFVDLKYVIQLNVPTEYTKYLNRIGRAGRHKDSEGTSYMIIDKEGDAQKVITLVDQLWEHKYKVDMMLLSFYKYHLELQAKMAKERFVIRKPVVDLTKYDLGDELDFLDGDAAGKNTATESVIEEQEIIESDTESLEFISSGSSASSTLSY